MSYYGCLLHKAKQLVNMLQVVTEIL